MPFSGSFLSLSLIILSTWGMPLSAVDGGDLLEALESGSYETAAADLVTAASGEALVYLGVLRNQQGRHGEACDAFARGLVRADAPHPDRILLRLRAESLLEMRCYTGARAVLTRLAREYPHSRLASRDHPLVQRIDRLLAGPVEPGHLAWYQREALAAEQAGSLGLAADLLAEYLRLADRTGVPLVDRRDNALLLAVWYRRLDAIRPALEVLLALPTWDTATRAFAATLAEGADLHQLAAEWQDARLDALLEAAEGDAP